LKTDNALKHRVTTLIRWHQTPMEDSDRRVKKMLSAVGEEAFFDLLDLMRADTAAQSERALPRLALLDGIEERARKLLQAGVALSVRDLAISGDDLSAMGIPPSPLMGTLLSAALDAVTEGCVANEKEALLAFVKQKTEKNEQ
jgi:tRNA nucleotidyltransferase (CCA-adding enzyme)